MALRVGSSILLSHPNYYPHANRDSNESGARQGFSFSGVATSTVIDVDTDYQLGMSELQIHPDCQKAEEHGVSILSIADTINGVRASEMADFTKYLQKYMYIQPRTYWWEFPFYTIIRSARQKFCLGNRPEDLEHITIIEKRAWEKHLTHLNRLERFPLDKAEYYLRLKESHGVNSIRGLARITGEDWSYIAKIIRTLELPESIKNFLQSNKNNPAILQFFHLRKLLDIVRQGEERLQLSRFRELMQEIEDKAVGDSAPGFRKIY